MKESLMEEKGTREEAKYFTTYVMA